MKTLKYFLIVLLFPAFVLTSCKDEKADNVLPQFDILKDYLIAQDMDIDHIIKNADGKKFVTGAPGSDAEVDAWATGFDILDIRSDVDFAKGYIIGAKNIAFDDILTQAEHATKPILVVCYTGQTACYATALLRLSGHDAQALKWGMSGWNADFDKWTVNIGNTANGHTNWTGSAAPQNQFFDDPVISTSATDGAGILAQQISKAVSKGFKGTGAVDDKYDVLENPVNYHINNYFSSTDYTNFGHIDGAYRINPLLLGDKSYQGLTPAGKNVTYCYTGQTSAVVAAYLNVIGYDAYSLKFGMNGLSNSNPSWETNQWGADSNPKSLKYED